MRTFEFWWFGLGGLGVWLLTRIWPRRVGSIATFRGVAAGSIVGPVAMLLVLWYLLDPISFGMKMKDPPPPPSLDRRIAQWMLAVLIPAALWTSLIVEPLALHQW